MSLFSLWLSLLHPTAALAGGELDLLLDDPYGCLDAEALELELQESLPPELIQGGRVEIALRLLPDGSYGIYAALYAPSRAPYAPQIDPYPTDRCLELSQDLPFYLQPLEELPWAPPRLFLGAEAVAALDPALPVGWLGASLSGAVRLKESGALWGAFALWGESSGEIPVRYKHARLLRLGLDLGGAYELSSVGSPLRIAPELKARLALTRGAGLDFEENYVRWAPQLGLAPALPLSLEGGLAFRVGADIRLNPLDLFQEGYPDQTSQEGYARLLVGLGWGRAISFSPSDRERGERE